MTRAPRIIEHAEEKRAEAAALFAKGWRIAAVSAELGVSVTTLYRWANADGFRKKDLAARGELRFPIRRGRTANALTTPRPGAERAEPGPGDDDRTDPGSPPRDDRARKVGAADPWAEAGEGFPKIGEHLDAARAAEEAMLAAYAHARAGDHREAEGLLKVARGFAGLADQIAAAKAHNRNSQTLEAERQDFLRRLEEWVEKGADERQARIDAAIARGEEPDEVDVLELRLKAIHEEREAAKQAQWAEQKARWRAELEAEGRDVT